MINCVSINFVFKLKLISDIVPSDGIYCILVLAYDCEFAILFDDIGDVLDESIKRVDLLPHQTILCEIAINNLPRVALVYGLV